MICAICAASLKLICAICAVVVYLAKWSVPSVPRACVLKDDLCHLCREACVCQNDLCHLCRELASGKMICVPYLCRGELRLARRSVPSVAWRLRLKLICAICARGFVSSKMICAICIASLRVVRTYVVVIVVVRKLCVDASVPSRPFCRILGLVLSILMDHHHCVGPKGLQCANLCRHLGWEPCCLRHRLAHSEGWPLLLKRDPSICVSRLEDLEYVLSQQNFLSSVKTK